MPARITLKTINDELARIGAAARLAKASGQACSLRGLHRASRFAAVRVAAAVAIQFP